MGLISVFMAMSVSVGTKMHLLTLCLLYFSRHTLHIKQNTTHTNSNHMHSQGLRTDTETVQVKWNVAYNYQLDFSYNFSWMV